MTTSRITMRAQPDAATRACDKCGKPTLQVAELVNEDGRAVGRTMVCTACDGAHRRAGSDS